MHPPSNSPVMEPWKWGTLTCWTVQCEVLQKQAGVRKCGADNDPKHSQHPLHPTLDLLILGIQAVGTPPTPLGGGVKSKVQKNQWCCAQKIEGKFLRGVPTQLDPLPPPMTPNLQKVSVFPAEATRGKRYRVLHSAQHVLRRGLRVEEAGATLAQLQQLPQVDVTAGVGGQGVGPPLAED